MEGTIEVLENLQLALWVILAGAAIRQWLIHRRPPERWIAITFSILGAVVVIGRIVPEDLDGLVGRVYIALVLAAIAMFPYSLFRFAATFGRTGTGWHRFAVVATAVVIVVGAAIDLPGPDEPRTTAVQVLVAAFLIQWVTLSIYAAVRLWRGGTGQPRVSRLRMRTLALGAIGLAAVLVLSGLAAPEEDDLVVRLIGQVLTFVSAPLFLLGFAPPRVVVWLWRRRDETALREAEISLMRSTDPDQVARNLLPHAVQMVGGSAGLLRENDGTVIASTGHADDLAALASRPPEDPTVVRAEMEDGELLILTTAYMPYFGKAELGLLAGLVAFSDLALARARLLADQARVTHELQIANQTMKEFVAIASHDLRTPLTVVQGLSQTLFEMWDKLPDDDKREQIGAVYRQAQHLSRIVEDLLTVSRIEAGGMTSAPRDLDLGREVEQIVADLGPSIEGIVVRHEGPVMVRVDPEHLARMVTNYVRNAQAHGEPPIQVWVTSNGDHGQVVVTDNGPGVPEDARGRLFEKFWRGDKVKSREAHGTGLGLAIVRGLAQAAGGDAWYEAGDGARFAFSLPLTTAQAHTQGSPSR